MAKDAQTERGHARLARWGRWVAARLTGWPAKTLLARVIELGAVGAAIRRAGGGTPAEMPPDVTEVEQAVCRLPQLERKLLHMYYVAGMTVDRIGKRLRRRPQTVSELLAVIRKKVAQTIEKTEEM